MFFCIFYIDIYAFRCGLAVDDWLVCLFVIMSDICVSVSLTGFIYYNTVESYLVLWWWWWCPHLMRSGIVFDTHPHFSMFYFVSFRFVHLSTTPQFFFVSHIYFFYTFFLSCLLCRIPLWLSRLHRIALWYFTLIFSMSSSIYLSFHVWITLEKEIEKETKKHSDSRFHCCVFICSCITL